MDNDYRRAANITVIIAGAIAFLWLFFKYALGAVIPFILGALIAALISPVADLISKKTKIPRKAVAATLTLLFFAAIATLIYVAISRLVSELGNLLLRLTSDPEAISGRISEIGRILGQKFGFLRKLFESDELKQLGLDLDRILPEALSSIVSRLSASLPNAAVGFFTKIPEMLLCVAVILISAFYFCCDRGAISGAFISLLPDHWQKRIPDYKKKVTSTLTGYLKAYLLIMLITFCEVFLGLSLLGVNYAFIVSIVVAIVDILPILGTGTVLVPWSIFAFVTSNTRLGIGLLILYGVVLVIRQFLEPKIVGTTLGIHPLATLASIYIGIKFLGFGGIFIGPVAAMLIKSFLFKKNETEKDSEAKV